MNLSSSIFVIDPETRELENTIERAVIMAAGQVIRPEDLPDGVFQMAVPGYVERPQAVTALRLLDLESGASVRTDLVESVAKVAFENLEDRLGWMAAKSIARGPQDPALFAPPTGYEVVDMGECMRIGAEMMEAMRSGKTPDMAKMEKCRALGEKMGAMMGQ